MTIAPSALGHHFKIPNDFILSRSAALLEKIVDGSLRGGECRRTPTPQHHKKDYYNSANHIREHTATFLGNLPILFPDAFAILMDERYQGRLGRLAIGNIR